MSNTILSKEFCHSNKGSWIYVKPSESTKILRIKEFNTKSRYKNIKNLIRNILLPEGYPDSVSPDYFEYQIWDTLQAFCSTITGTLAMKAVFSGLGVGDSSSTPLAAVFTWMTKDGISMVGKIAFAWWKGSELDFNCKKWRLFADILNDLALLTDLCIPFFNQSTVTTILCITTTMKGIVGVAGGATRASLTQHQAIKGNSADVSAKDSSQETCVNLSATILSLIILTYITNNSIIWILFLFFTSSHIFCNYYAVRALCMNSLNEQRLLIVLQEYLQNGKILVPKIVNKNENVILGTGLSANEICGYKIHIGASMETCFKDADEIINITHLYEEDNFLLIVDEKDIKIAFNLEIKNEDIIRSYFHAIILAFINCVYYNHSLDCIYDERKQQISDVLDNTNKNNLLSLKNNSEIKNELNKIAKSYAENECNNFINLLNEKGWNTNINHIYKDDWKLIWGKHLS